MTRLLIGPVLTAIGALSLVTPDLISHFFQGRYYGFGQGWGRGFSWLFFFFALSWTVIVLPWSFASYWIASSHLASGDYAVAEGPVTDFVAGTSDKAEERFIVGGRQFSYSEYTTTLGFNKTVAQDKKSVAVRFITYDPMHALILIEDY